MPVIWFKYVTSNAALASPEIKADLCQMFWESHNAYVECGGLALQKYEERAWQLLSHFESI